MLMRNITTGVTDLGTCEGRGQLKKLRNMTTIQGDMVKRNHAVELKL